MAGSGDREDGVAPADPGRRPAPRPALAQARVRGRRGIPALLRPPVPVANERRRHPRPLIRRRLPSGRGATEQPNATGDADTPLTATFWLLVVATGVAAGLFGGGLMALLHAVQHLCYGYQHGSFQAAVENVPGYRRVLALLGAGLFGGPAWYLLRKWTAGLSSDVDEATWTGSGELSMRRSLPTSVISEVVIGAGVSLGREAAPKLMGAVAGSVLARWRGLTPGQRRLLVACGGGAGMAAVYNVPLGGALITAELLYGSLALPVILPALACSWIATATSWVVLPVHATYTNVPAYPLRASEVVFAVLAGPVVGLVAVGYVRLIGWVSFRQVRGRRIMIAMPVAFVALGVLSLRYPQLLGNGKDMTHVALLSTGTEGFGLVLALFALKPLVTAMCLGSGATGGLFTPTMSTGAMLGLLLGGAWSLAWPGAAAGSFAVIGAAAMIGAAMQTPLAALVLMVELTHTVDTLIVPMIAATMLATAVVRYVDGYSIYSSRLPAQSALSS